MLKLILERFLWKILGRKFCPCELNPNIPGRPIFIQLPPEPGRLPGHPRHLGTAPLLRGRGSRSASRWTRPAQTRMTTMVRFVKTHEVYSLRRPVMSWVRFCRQEFGEFPRLVGSYCSYSNVGSVLQSLKSSLKNSLRQKVFFRFFKELRPFFICRKTF